MHTLSVIEGETLDDLRSVRVEKMGPDRARLSLVDLFAGTRPFMEVALEYASLVMTLGGACIAVKTDDARFALYPVRGQVRVTFQADGWPFPEEWSVPRDEFNSAVLALL
jgi:hypothetical protein